MLRRLIKLLNKFPVKSIFIAIIILVVLAIGARNIEMATGDDTLVKDSTDVYKDNVMLEEEFGGESVVVLYESEDLLTPGSLSHMKALADILQTNDSIYSVMSPVTLVEQIANKQADTFKEGISDVIDGLATMGSKLTDIGNELEKNAKSGSEPMEFPSFEVPALPNLGSIQLPAFESEQLPAFEGIDPPSFETPKLPEFKEVELPNIEKQMAELNEGFSSLINAQENLGDGTFNLVEGYAEFGGQTNKLGEELKVLADEMEDSPGKKELSNVSTGLIQLSEKMTKISEDTEQLPTIPTNTIDGLKSMQGKLKEQLQEQKEQQEQIGQKQKKQQEEIEKQMQKEQEDKEKQMEQEIKEQVDAQKQKQAAMQQEQEQKQAQMKQEMERAQTEQQKEIKEKMNVQQDEKEAEMKELQTNMQEKQAQQATKLSSLSEGLSEMGENLQTISENLEMIYGYSDIMTAGIPSQQLTLDNMIYEDGELRSMFDEVIVDDKHMLMMITFNGDTNDTEKSIVVDDIQTYLASEENDALEAIVSGKPVLDNAIRSSMKESMQVMLVLALSFMFIVLFLVFNVRWRLLPLVTVLVAVVGTIGAMGWFNISITMVSMAVFPILIGLGIDYGIQFQNRYEEELSEGEEDTDE